VCRNASKEGIIAQLACVATHGSSMFPRVNFFAAREARLHFFRAGSMFPRVHFFFFFACISRPLRHRTSFPSSDLEVNGEGGAGKVTTEDEDGRAGKERKEDEARDVGEPCAGGFCACDWLGGRSRAKSAAGEPEKIKLNHAPP